MKKVAAILIMGLLACSCHTTKQISRSASTKDSTGKRKLQAETRVRVSGSLQLEYSRNIEKK